MVRGRPRSAVTDGSDIWHDDPMALEGSTWVKIGLACEQPQISTFKHGQHQLCVMNTDDGFHAVDNRCPHEGYPLASGDLKGCVLTCAWHNWKFDARSGECTLGGEDVRVYPTRIGDDGTLEVDLADPDSSTTTAASSATVCG